ncbi:Predicted arabinose efflux permease, MFS family [Cnuella takakiae]|uniref:Predicted arabinose efflux permease, MFS family n=1 Tax=Cnuella takakiae TaxID=1302690 RepID=A0A1M5HJT6_9BACT|nr:MFS transporter [Cnuella takakiae]OLY92897.1 hypothetical protein BUE76_14115 [Cnuella takakiae]SHG16239.1 Predicted arabinose efflux permease, MFS family [Cnuella takakiae]
MPRHSLPLIVFAQFAGTSLWFAGNAVLVGQQGLSAAALTASVQLGFIAGTLLFALMALADRWPATRLFLLCSLSGALSNALIPFFLSAPWLVLALRVLTGFFLAGIYPVGMKIAADLFPKGLGVAMGWLVGALVLGTAFPHLLKGQLSQWPAETLLWTISGLATCGGILLYLLIPSNLPFLKSNGGFTGSIRSIVKEKPFLKPAFGYLGHMWELYTFWAFVPLLLQSHPSLKSQNGSIAVYAFYIIAIGALGCILGGLYARRTSSRKVSQLALAISGFCCLALPWAAALPLNGYLFYLLTWGFAVVADSPQLSALAAQTAPPQLKGTALSLLTCAGFGLTVVSLLFIQYLAARLAQPHLAMVALAPGPLMGLLALRKAAV